VVRIVSILIVASWLAGAPPPEQPAQPTPPPAQPTTQQPPPQPPQPTQPPRTTPPPEQQPAPTPTPTQTPPPPDTPTVVTTPTLPAPSMDPDRKTALALLERIETLLEGSLQDKSDKDKSDKSAKDKSDKNRAVGTSGAEIKPGSLEAKSGRITIDRATLDEILSEVAQVKTMLQR